MGFGVPLGFLWLLGWGVVLLLHFLQRRFRREEVSALFLWERIPEHPLSFRERLRTLWDLLLFLQLLAMGLLGVAFAEPLMKRESPSGAVALLLDGSATMGAKGRPEEAKRIAVEIVRNSTGPWVVVLWAEPPCYLVSPTRDRATALRGISRYAPTHGRRSPLPEALAYLAGEWERVVIITDSPPADTQGFEVIALPPVEDLALTAFALRPPPQGPGYEAYVAVRNGTSMSRSVAVTVRVGEYAFRERLQVPPGEERGLSFPYFGPIYLGFVARIETNDAYPANDVRYFSFGPSRILRARWVGEDDRFLRAALQATGSVSFTDQPPWDLTVAVRTELREVTGPTLLWESSAPGVGLGELVHEGDWKAEDELLADLLDLSQWDPVGTYSVEPPRGARILLRRGSVPAVFVAEVPGGRLAVAALSFGGAEGVLLSPDFPLLVHHLLSSLLPPIPRGTYEVGEAIELPQEAVLLEGREELRGSFIPEAPGLYRVRIGKEGTFTLAVNLPREELIPTSETIRSQISQREATGEAEFPLWRFWAWTLLGVLLVEGALALRRW